MKRNIYKYLLILGTLFITLLSILGCSSDISMANASSTKVESTQGTKEVSGTMKVHVLDIGQGDAILIQVGDSFTNL